MFDKNRLHRCMNALLANGLQDDADPETARVTGVANLFYGVTALFSGVMALLAFMQDQGTLALFLLAMLALALFGLFWVGRTGRHVLPSTTLVLALFTLSLYMVSHGGVEGSGFVWLFIFPPVVMLTFGLSIGILLMGALLCFALFNLISLHSLWGWLFVLAAPLLIKQARFVMRELSPAAMPPMLERTVKGALLTNLLFVIGIVLSQTLS